MATEPQNLPNRYNDQSNLVVSLSSVVRSLSSVVCRLSSVICRLSSVVCHLSSVNCPRPLYICREPSTNQPFYAKQTQSAKSQMNVTPYNTTDYENIANWTLGQNKPNSNPNKPNLVRRRRIANECKLTYNKGLQKKR